MSSGLVARSRLPPSRLEQGTGGSGKNLLNVPYILVACGPIVVDKRILLHVHILERHECFIDAVEATMMM